MQSELKLFAPFLSSLSTSLVLLSIARFPPTRYIWKRKKAAVAKLSQLSSLSACQAAEYTSLHRWRGNFFPPCSKRGRAWQSRLVARKEC